MATKKYQKARKIDQTAMKCTYKHLPLQDTTKLTQIGIFGFGVWFENLPSGNPGAFSRCWKLGLCLTYIGFEQEGFCKFFFNRPLGPML
jgi:hypothetical protein